MLANRASKKTLSWRRDSTWFHIKANINIALNAIYRLSLQENINPWMEVSTRKKSCCFTNFYLIWPFNSDSQSIFLMVCFLFDFHGDNFFPASLYWRCDYENLRKYQIFYSTLFTTFLVFREDNLLNVNSFIFFFFIKLKTSNHPIINLAAWYHHLHLIYLLQMLLLVIVRMYFIFWWNCSFYTFFSYYWIIQNIHLFSAICNIGCLKILFNWNFKFIL